MKEFSAQTGGRFTYADDLENLQELALAFSQLFDDCDNFIISGCEVVSGGISAGYVFLNGKIRYFSGAAGISSWPQYIYELNTTESVPYESGGSKVGRNDYGCAIANTAPMASGSAKAPQSIIITEAGGLRMKDAFIGKYALLLNPARSSQTINSQVTFSQQIQADADLIANQDIVLKSDSARTTLSYDGSAFTIETVGDEHSYRFASDEEGFHFFVDGVAAADIRSGISTFNRQVHSAKGWFGGLMCEHGDIYHGLGVQESTLYINRLSFQGGTTAFRNTCIGNGKGDTIFSITGANGNVDAYGRMQITAGQMDGLVLKANVLQNNNSLTNAIAWTDSVSAVMARVGFLDTDNQIFSIASANHSISINGYQTVNIGPAIMENGQLLSEKYAIQTDMTDALNKKADSDKVYSTTQADEKFATKSGGLLQFVNDTNDAAACRQHIGALGTDDLSAYAKISDYLADMAKTENDKQRIRTNIGAAGINDYQPKLTDSGWIRVSDKGSLYARQIGNMVCIQGKLTTIKSGTAFYIPNSIAAPTYDVAVTIAPYDKRNWGCAIKAGTRTCFVTVCDGTEGRTTEFSLTYMI